MTRRSHRGFGLLEAIVALVLLAGTGVALFGWVQQNLQTASRLRVHEQQARLMSSAQALVDTVNPLLAPKGRMEASGIEIEWQAEPIEPPRNGSSLLVESASPWQLGLFRVAVHATDTREHVDVRYEQWRLGARRAAVEDRPFENVRP